MPKLPIYFDWPGTVWLHSDPHFNHEGLLKYERTQFTTIEDMNKRVLNGIRSRVNKGDTFVCLGDLGTGWEEFIEKINCSRKVLVLGNHDKESKGKYAKYFDEVYSGPIFINKWIILSHDPVPVSEHFINIHGHLHGAKLDSERHFSVSANDIDYMPVTLDSFFGIISNLPKVHQKFLNEWYADLYVFDSDRTDVPLYSEDHHIIPSREFNFLEKYGLTYRDMGNYKFSRESSLGGLEAQLLSQIEYLNHKYILANIYLDRNSKGNILVETDEDYNIIKLYMADIDMRIIKNINEILISPAYSWNPATEENFIPISAIDEKMIIEEFSDEKSAEVYFNLNYEPIYNFETFFTVRRDT